MPTSPTVRFAYLLLMLPAAAVLAVLAVIAVRQGLATGLGEALMLIWIVVFTVVLPLALLVPPVLAARPLRKAHSPVIPLTGVKVP